MTPGPRGRRRTWRSVAVAVVVALGACDEPGQTPTPSPPVTAGAATPEAVYIQATFADMPGWTADAVSEALVAVQRSCARIRKLPADRSLGADGIAGTAGDWSTVCADATALPADQTRAWLEQAFVPVAIAAAGSDGLMPEGLFTGYYEPELRGSRTADDTFRYPLHASPGDLITADLGAFVDDLAGRTVVGRVADGRFVPFWSRAEIDGGILDGRGLELLWLDDPVERFFLHIQGSGRVVLTDGSVVRVGYAGKNGRPFTAIGRVLLEAGALDRGAATMQGIKAWLADHPERRDATLNLNESYIFFRLITGDGPIGAEGVPLTPGRSLAVDRRFVPFGVPVWLATTHPLRPSEPYQRLMVAQDTGSAIIGPVRGDVFWGAGEDAALAAGAMSQRGRLWLLLPRAVAVRAAS